MQQNELLFYTVGALDDLRIPYMVCGSLASSAYGHPRLTNDIDIVADLYPKHISSLLQKFPVEEFYLSENALRQAIQTRSQFNIIHPSSGYKVDIFICGLDAFGRSQIQRRRLLQVMESQAVYFASPEDVIIKKMDYFKAGESERQFPDIVGILQICGDQLDYDYIKIWAQKFGLTEIWESILQKKG